MRIQVGDQFACCPYCGGLEFQPPPDAEELLELECAACGGHASRKIVLERLGDEAMERARASLEQLKKDRR